jgi:hypothetical protein
MSSHEMNLLKATMHPINFCISWRPSSSFILVMTDTFSGLRSIPRQETIYPSNFSEGTPNVHFLGFSSILIFFLRLSNVSARSEMSFSESLRPCCQRTLQRCAQAVNADTIVYPVGKLHMHFLV